MFSRKPGTRQLLKHLWPPVMEETKVSDQRTADELLLQAQGHAQELPRSFSAYSALSLGFVVTNSWLGYSATFVTP
jgi:hypothetical protein